MGRGDSGVRTGRSHRCPPHSLASTSAPGCTWWSRGGASGVANRGITTKPEQVTRTCVLFSS